MKRIRFTLVLLALGIALPATLIIQRAIASLELENVIRHEAVAERVFDEMERSLSDFLLREESRPVTDYRVSGPSDGLPAAFAGVSEPFVLGWFALEPRGEPRIFARDPGDEPRVAAGLRDALLAPAANEPAETLAKDEGGVPAPGRTKSLGSDLGERRKLQAALLEQKEQAESSAYEVLQSLNRARSIRDERQSMAKRKSAPSAPTSRSLTLENEAPRDRSSLGTLDYPELEFADPNRAMASASDRPELDDAPSALDSETRKDHPAAAVVTESAPSKASAPIVDPLIGRVTAGDDLVVTRSVWRPDGVERQGLVIDRAALIDWLAERVLAETGLANVARIDFASPNLAPRNEAEHRYLHRFAEPFDGLVAHLDLAPLPGFGSARPIYALALLLGLVATIGLLAVDRMTRVVVEFAKRRGDFVAAVSHELKTPLTSIRMYGEMLRDGLVSSDSKRDEYYATITDESERLSRLIDNVLKFSRLEQNRRELSLVVGSLSEAIREAAGKLRAHVDREGFRLELDLEEDLPPVQYDRDAVTQLVFNLVDNALKYARNAETPDIEIALRREDDGITLCIRDFGPGVPENQLRRIFEPFYRIGEEMTRTSEGTGIGLALVKELSESMGAVVSGRNAMGGGLEIRIAFRAAA